MPGNQAKRKSRARQLLCPSGMFPPRAVMSHHVDEEQQIKFSELSNIEHRVRERKITLAL